jgi:uncharacterized membrane protein
MFCCRPRENLVFKWRSIQQTGGNSDRISIADNYAILGIDSLSYALMTIGEERKEEMQYICVTGGALNMLSAGAEGMYAKTHGDTVEPSAEAIDLGIDGLLKSDN